MSSALTQLQVADLVVGTGRETGRRGIVQVHYIGRLMNGTVFDSSYESGRTMTVQLGTRQVIRGWDEGIPGMREGGKRSLRIPAKMAYGTQGFGSLIPPNSDLEFEVEIIKVLA
jgi:peptidylprolyl isomerase